MEKPKRPLSAYMLWLNHAREGIKKDNPGIKVTEIAKKGGEIWRGMKDKSVSEYDITEWEGKAAKLKDEYTKAVQEFERNGGSKETGGGGGGGKKRAKAPKKPAKKSKKKESEEDDEESGEESE